jgi:hypothetical protein
VNVVEKGRSLVAIADSSRGRGCKRRSRGPVGRGVVTCGQGSALRITRGDTWWEVS